jgi:hypothetical protein
MNCGLRIADWRLIQSEIRNPKSEMFLNPLMLFGLSAVSVPVIIHLLNNRKFQRIRWAAMRFLRASVERNRRRMRIEDVLLLLVRCVIVMLLALALARPVLRRAAGAFLGRSAVTAVIVIDNSASMSATDGVSSRFDLAKRAATQVIDSMPAGSSVAVWLNSDSPHPIIPEPTMELNLARAAVRDATMTDRASDVLPAVQEAAEMLKRRAGATRELYVITDGQLLGWKRLEDVRRVLDGARPDFRSRIVLVGQKQDSNLSLSGLEQASGLAPVGRPLRFQVSVTNHGAAEARDVRVRLFVNAKSETLSKGDANLYSGAPVADGVIDRIEPGATKIISLFARLPTAGYHVVTASLERDHVPADDARTVAVRAVEKVNVLLVDGDPGREPRDSEVFFLRHALLPVPPAEQDAYFVKVVTVLPSELAAQNLDDFDAVALANVPDLAPATLDALSPYVSRGGGLLVFPGDHVNVAFYNEQLFAGGALLPSRLADPAGDARAEKPLTSLQDKNFDHPIAAIWNDPASGAPSSANFYRRIPLSEPSGDTQPATAPSDAPRVVMRFADGSPAITERPVGRGRVILFSSTADTAWNDLPVKPGIFVPLIYRALGSIVTRQDEGLLLRAGEKFVFHPPADLIANDAIFKTPSDAPGRAGRSRRVELVDRQATLTFDETDVAGAYEVKIGESPAVKFAVQSDPAESDLAMLGPDHAKTIEQFAEMIVFDKTPQLAQVIEQGRIGKELWMPIVMIALALAASETLLAHWFSRPK